jgi:hypothetical protein
MRRVSAFGVLIGGITDIFTSTVLGVPAIVYVHLTYHPIPGSGGAIKILFSNPWLVGTIYLTGFAGSILGGYVAGWIAKHDQLLNGLLSSFLCVALAIHSIVSGKSPALYADVSALVTSPIFGLLGGYLRYRRTSNADLVGVNE